jgi:hypothetical protein
MTWVQNGALPDPAELNQTLILGTALLAAILGWDGPLLAMTDKPLFGFCRFLINLALVFIYMFLLMASAHPECLLWTLSVIFALYVLWDVSAMREQIASYDPALAGVQHTTAGQIWNIYAGGFAGRPQIPHGPAITLAWAGYFVLLALIANGRAYEHLRTTCVFALIGLVSFWIDATPGRRTASATVWAGGCSSSWARWLRRRSISGSGPAREAQSRRAAGDGGAHPTALSTLPPAVTGLAATSTKAMTHGAVPLFTQLWMVPRCTSTSPALRWTLLPSSSSMSISPEITTA